MNNKTMSSIKRILWMGFCGLAWASSAQAASFDCAKVQSKVEHLICDNPEISKLDDELDAEYKVALQDQSRANATRFSQKQWMKERNACADTSCLEEAYVKRTKHLQKANSAASAATKITTQQSEKAEEIPGADAFKGEYMLIRAYPGDYSVCQRFKDNLNRYRKIDFDQCNPRLSGKFPEFSRPQWKEIPFDMTLAEKVIRSTTDRANYGGAESVEDAEYDRNEGEKRWQQWLKGSASFHEAGQAHMWITKIDMDGDGKEDTILRMTPGGRYPIDPKRPSLWSCDYNIGELYVIESENPHMAALFNLDANGSDIIHYAEDGNFYLIKWSNVTSTTTSWFGGAGPDIGGTRGVIISSLYMISPDSYAMPATMCLIDWVPTGHFIPAPKQN